MKTYAFVSIVIGLSIVFLSTGAQGALLRLSTHASDGTDPPTYDKLDATLDFFVLGTELTLTVFNMTPENTGDPELKINEIYFNVSDNVWGLTLFKVGGKNPAATEWTGSFNKDSILVNSFGEFDVSIIDGGGIDPDVIDPKETLIFIFNITDGTGSYSDSDFIFKSYIIDHPEHTASYAAAKFYNGPPEMSAYGATNVPEPASMLLLGLGALALLRKRRV